MRRLIEKCFNVDSITTFLQSTRDKANMNTSTLIEFGQKLFIFLAFTTSWGLAENITTITQSNECICVPNQCISEDQTTKVNEFTDANIQSTGAPNLVTSVENGGFRNGTSKIPIYLAGFFSLHSDFDMSGLLPAVELALDHINERSDILAEYELKMEWNDTQVCP